MIRLICGSGYQKCGLYEKPFCLATRILQKLFLRSFNSSSTVTCIETVPAVWSYKHTLVLTQKNVKIYTYLKKENKLTHTQKEIACEQKVLFTGSSSLS